MKIRSNIRDYEVRFSRDAGFFRDFDRFPQRCYVVDSNVWERHAGGALRALAGEDAVVLPVNEERKNLETVQELYDRLTDRSAKKNMTMITVGGGTLQDISGFAASTLYRGVNWVFVPTTLLAQSDSCIGSKTSLNYRRFKNLIGTFYPPSEVHIWPGFLSTLRDEDFYSGLGEVLKLHLMGGEGKIREIVSLLPGIRRRESEPLHAAVRNSLAIKLDYISGDEFDTGRRNLLNFGHCFGHALETASRFEIPHGQAVLIGIIFAGIAARNRGILAKETHEALLRTVLLDNVVSRPAAAHLAFDGILEAMKQDKKRVGDGLALVMLRDGFDLVKAVDFHEKELSQALDELACLLG